MGLGVGVGFWSDVQGPAVMSVALAASAWQRFENV